MTREEATTMSVRVRRLAARDKPAWLRPLQGLHRVLQGDRAGGRDRDDVAAADAGAADFHIALVAVDDADTPVGLAHVLFHRSTWSPTWYCYLEDLFVDPAQRAKGVGRALIEAVYAEADARGCTRTYWMTQEFNYRGARALRPGGDQVAVRAVSAVKVSDAAGLIAAPHLPD